MTISSQLFILCCLRGILTRGRALEQKDLERLDLGDETLITGLGPFLPVPAWSCTRCTEW